MAEILLGNIKGPKGENGLSAYEIAVENGFIGTEQEWLESLKGDGSGSVGAGNTSQLAVSNSANESSSGQADTQADINAENKVQITALWVAENNVENRVGAIEGKIPNQATSGNQLADKAFVNSSIEQSAANRVTYNTQGDGFPTRADLMTAVTFYHGGAVYTPTKNDYAIVIADEGAPAPFTEGQTRFAFDGTIWAYAYGINNRPFTSAEVAAIESGITEQKVADIDNKLDKATSSGEYRAYAEFSGNQRMIDISKIPKEEALVWMNYNGGINVGQITADIYYGYDFGYGENDLLFIAASNFSARGTIARVSREMFMEQYGVAEKPIHFEPQESDWEVE